MELTLVKELNDAYILEWSPDKRCAKYIVQGLSDIFTYTTVLETKESVAVVRKTDNIVGYRIAYVVQGYKDVCIKESNILMVIPQNDENIPINIHQNEELEKIDLFYVPTPNGYAVSFRSEKQYSLYKIYSDEKIIKETEDCLVLFRSPICPIEVKAFDEDGNLVAKSNLEEPIQLITDKKRKKTLTIGIPVYNGRNFFIRTMSSILCSTFQEFEIVIIDDSTDKETSRACDWYEEKFSFIRVKHQDRKGICVARNYLLDQAKTPWFAFVDADDIIHPYMYEKLYKNAIDYNADVAISQVIIRDDLNKTTKLLTEDGPIKKSFAEIFDRSTYFVGTWNKIVKTEIAKKVRFADDRPYYEDIAYTPSMYSYAEKFVYVNDAYYIWDKRKRLTVGTSSEEVNEIPNEDAWRFYLESCLACIKDGNQDPKVADIYKIHVMEVVLNKYKEMSRYSNIKHIFSETIKELTQDVKMPVGKLNNPSLEKLWKELRL